ncbi:MAG: MotA/TolQ/ExbB proton channel family protein [Polyangiales bacterium]
MLSVFLQTSAPEQLNPWQLVIGASPVVQFVLLILAFMMVMCLYIIGAKWIRLKQVTDQSRGFLALFWAEERTRTWNGKAMNEIHGLSAAYERSPIATVFRAGYRELARIARGGRPSIADIGNVERALRRAQSAELTRLENKVSFLATTASTAPFVGLFGTVWGVMNAFIAIHGEKSAGLDVVAPGIAEALIATALGLAAAIPAVMAYNYFVRRIRVVDSETAAFASDYLNIIRRHLLVD